MARHVYSQAAIEHEKHNSGDSNLISLNDKDWKYAYCELRTGAKSALYICPVTFESVPEFNGD